MRTNEEIKSISKMWAKDIAKYIREDLKERFGKDFKFSVTVNGGCYTDSIYVGVVKGNIDIENIEYQIAEKKGDINTVNNLWSEGKRFSQIGEEFLEEVEKIRNRYNYDNGDYMRDYSDKNYYGNVTLGTANKIYQKVTKKNS